LESNGNTIQTCYIGTNSTGAVAARNGGDGILIEGSATKNTIGGTTTAARNLISGNGVEGILLTGAGVTKNIVEGNYIGCNVAGAFALSNRYDGVALTHGATDNTIGGDASDAFNFIAGNSRFGINISGTGTSGNIIDGNGITSNLSNGIQIFAAATNNIIGGIGSGNVISANDGNGVVLTGVGVTGNIVEGNAIGTNGAETSSLGNVASGIEISQGATGNTIGGTALGTENLISGNGKFGIVITDKGTSGNTVTGNGIGLDAAGTAALPNIGGGIQITASATNNAIGGTATGAGNLISGNDKFGIVITSTGTSGNTVTGNVIGLNDTGNAALANTGGGIEIASSATNNIIGGNATGARNEISGNGGDGILLTGVGVTGNVIEGDYIGTNLNGSAAVANKDDGVGLSAGATGNFIGGTATGAGNLISGNSGYGVHIFGTGTSGNTLLSNTIGLNALGTAALANATGVFINASGNTIGGTITGAGNTISGNKDDGILIFAANKTVVESNRIGTLSGGTGVFGNGSQGVFITDGSANNTVGGTVTGAGNVIANNGGVGVLIGSDPSAGFTIAAGTGNAILGNSIFANAHLGIDLGPKNGVTPNHPAGLTPGPNHYQNYATITSATTLSGGTQIQIDISLISVPNTTFRIEVFADPTADKSGFGQGQNFLGFIEVTTNASGVATGSATFTYSSSLGSNISLTTTNEKTNDTSEFAQSVSAT
jgi:titin